jgi:hypothetical protein
LKDEGRTFGEKYPVESIAAWNSLTGHYYLTTAPPVNRSLP